MWWWQRLVLKGAERGRGRLEDGFDLAARGSVDESDAVKLVKDAAARERLAKGVRRAR